MKENQPISTVTKELYTKIGIKTFLNHPNDPNLWYLFREVAPHQQLKERPIAETHRRRNTINETKLQTSSVAKHRTSGVRHSVLRSPVTNGV
jgi:hypothetical protein